MNPAPRSRLPGLPLFLAAWLLLVTPRAARAGDQVSYKYQDYREADGRIGVQVHSALVEKDFGTAMVLKLSGVIDTIAGATPNGRPPATPGGALPVVQIKEERKAWNAEFSRQFPRINVTAGLAQSRESDYISHGWSLNTLTDFNQKNTTLLAGVAGTADDVKVFFQQPWARKRGLDVIAGVNQLLDPRTAVTFNLTYSRATGYLSDPYKLVEKRVEALPGIFLKRTFFENRPDARNRWIALAAFNRAWPGLHGALDASYRYHRDDLGISSHTVNLEWFQKLGERLILRPSVRLFTQGAADFYFVTLDGTTISPPPQPTGQAPYYSADYRLSELRTWNYGLKLVWTPVEALQLDVAVEKYEMHGRDGVTSALAYPRATIFTTGVRFSF